MISGKAFAGHPVDVATGVEFIADHDIEIDGVAPLIFRRAYSTGFLDRPPSVLGQGWVHHFDACLVRNSTGFEFEGHDGERIQFDDIAGTFEKTGSILNAGNCMELRRAGSNLVVYHWHGIDEPVQRYIFKPVGKDYFRFITRALPSGQGLVIDYDPQGRVATVTQSTEGRCLFFLYNRAGLLSELQLGVTIPAPKPEQIVARYVYDANGHLTAVYDALGNAHIYGYDDAGRLIYERGRRGGEFHMKYDDRGRCVETVGSDGYQFRRFKYNEETRTTWVGDNHNNWTTYRYNANGQILFKTLPNGALYATEYDDLGRIVLEKGSLGATTCFEFDEQGNLKHKTHSNGGVQQYVYDAEHQPTQITDPDGAVWKLKYERGALVEVGDHFGATTKYRRDKQNNLIGAESPTGNQIKIWFDKTWTAEVISDTYGVISKRRLNLRLLPTEISDASGAETQINYDVLGRAVEVVYPDGACRRFEYDAQGSVVRSVDARGGERHSTLSPYGDDLEFVDELGRSFQYQRDTEGRLTSIRTPKGELTKIRYDSDSRPIETTHFDGSVEKTEYNLAGYAMRRHRADGTVIEVTRDVANNIKTIVCAGKVLRSFEYNSAGDITKGTSPDAEVSFTFEAGGRISSESINGRKVSYEYHDNGAIARRSLDGSKAGPIEFGYDLRRRLTEIRTAHGIQQQLAYDGRNLLATRRTGAVSEVMEFDAVGQPRTQVVANVCTRHYAYDAEGSLISILDSLRGRRTFTYDKADQLINSTSPGGERRYEFDGHGNLLGKNETSLHYGGGDQVEQYGPHQFERDAIGQVRKDTLGAATTSYDWDAMGQLKKVVHPDGKETSFGYDAFDRRVYKEHGLDRTTFFWAGNELICEDFGDSQREYFSQEFRPLALWDNGEIRHVTMLPNGTPQELIDRKGTTVWRGCFDDWGSLVKEDGPAKCRLRLLGQYADEETNLHYNGFRYYSPNTGQFISPDPVGFWGGSNRFRFAPNTLGWLDPLGLFCGKSGCKVPKPPKGKGSVPKDKRDKSRLFTRGQVQDALDSAGGVCPGCDKPLCLSDAKGHHITRHADGGPTTPANLASLCPDCHKDVHH